MKCEECGINEATFILTKIVGNKKTVMHMCKECALIKEGISSSGPKETVGNLIAEMVGQEVGHDALKKSSCPVCGCTYTELKDTGKLGCASCYDVFENYLGPLLKKLHGSVVHEGIVPKALKGHLVLQRDLNRIRSELKEAVSKEEFEHAAELRDRIAELEKKIAEDHSKSLKGKKK